MKQSSINKIKEKFNELKMLDQNQKALARQKQQDNSKENLFKFLKHGFYQQQQNAQQKKDNNEKYAERYPQNLDTQSDIAKQLAKLKPYLVTDDDPKTSQQIEQLKKRACSKENYKMMCQLAIIENQKLCQILERQQQNEQNFGNRGTVKRIKKQDEGWIFQVFYRCDDIGHKIQKKGFNSGYAVMTDIVEIYESLNFQKKLKSINPAHISYVKYLQDQNYQIIHIQQTNQIIQIGFLSNNKMNLFDRMLFLQKNMARSTNTRLFQNQLLRSIYEDY